MAAELTVGLLAGDDSAGLLRSAACVLNQSWTGSLNLIVVADTGTREMERAIQRLQERFRRITVLAQPLSGIAHSRNEILRNADTRFLAWIDAGELWHPHKLDLQFQALEAAPSCEFALSRFRECLEDGFTALLGETQSWHRIGELDEQLACLADEEFLLRLVLSDVSITTVACRTRLYGAARTLRECRWQALVADATTVWERHGDRMRSKVGADAAAEYRRRQLLRVAEAATRAGDTLQAARYRWMVRVSGLTARNRDAVRAHASALVRRSARAVAGGCLRMGARLITTRRLQPDSRLIAGIARFLESPVAKPYFALAPSFSDFVAAGADTAVKNDEPDLPTSDRRILIVAAAAIAAGEAARAVDVLKVHIGRDAPAAHPRIFERLAAAHLGSGHFDDAEDVLRKGVQSYPANGRLHRALAETLAGKSEWREAVEHWERVPDDLRKAASLWTRIGVARAYRQSGKPKEAHAVASQAAESQPDNPQLAEEIALCRPFLVDWPRSLVGLDDGPDRTGTSAGVVESMGFLEGSTEPLIGRLTSPVLQALDVSLRVNGCKVASTTVAGDSIPAEARVFAINCAALLEYLGDGDVIELLCDGSAVSLPGLGPAAMVYGGLPSRFQTLMDRLHEGWVFTKDGRLRPGHTESSKRATLDLYTQVADLLEARTSQQVYPFYGNLLGAIREGDFIAHDVDGFDLLYLCEASRPEAVKSEVDAVCRFLRDEGYNLKIRPWSVMIRKQPADSLFLDLNYGWFNAADEFNASFGWRFRPARGRERFVRRRNCRLADRVVAVPGNAEEVLEQLYGPGWRVLDQGFATRSCLVRDDAYRLASSD